MAWLIIGSSIIDLNSIDCVRYTTEYRREPIPKTVHMSVTWVPKLVLVDKFGSDRAECFPPENFVLADMPKIAANLINLKTYPTDTIVYENDLLVGPQKASERLV